MLFHDPWDHVFVPDTLDPRKSYCKCGTVHTEYDPEAEEEVKKQSIERFQKGF